MAKCENCQNCLLACKDEHTGNDWPGYAVSQPAHGQRWITIARKERGQFPLIDVAYRPTPCMHCDDAPCIEAAQNGAIYKRRDGIVLIDPGKAKGQKHLLKACPYGAIGWNAEKDLPQKCTLCAHLLDNGWQMPRCVQACPTGALQVVHQEDEKIAARIAETSLEVLNPRLKSRPRVWYKNLYRYSQCFIGGSVSYDKGGVVDCARGARVRLSQNASVIQETTSDSFGDFKFDHLEENSGVYTLEFCFKDYTPKTLEVALQQSVSIEDIHFTASFGSSNRRTRKDPLKQQKPQQALATAMVD